MNCNNYDLEFLKDCALIDYSINLYCNYKSDYLMKQIYFGKELAIKNLSFYEEKFIVEMLNLKKSKRNLINKLSKSNIQQITILNRKLERAFDNICITNSNFSKKIVALYLMKIRFLENKTKYGWYLNNTVQRNYHFRHVTFIYNLVFDKEFSNKHKYIDEYNIAMLMNKEFNRQRSGEIKLCVS